MASTKRNPAKGVAGFRGNDHAREADRREPKAQIAKIQEPDGFPERWINVGLECIGRLYAGRNGFGAFSNDGRWLGEFPTVPAARSRIWETHIERIANSDVLAPGETTDLGAADIDADRRVAA
jgi:hypothetical protein